jgi:hypothetical protein
MRETQRVQLPNLPTDIPATQLGEFFTLLSLAYGITSTLPEATRRKLIETQSRPELLRAIKQNLPRLLISSGGTGVLRCRKLKYGSPLEIWLFGVPSALILALILAGGEFKAFGLTIKINKSLGASIGDLKKLFLSDKERVRELKTRAQASKGTPAKRVAGPETKQITKAAAPRAKNTKSSLPKPPPSAAP